MLVLTRKQGEKIQIGPDVEITVVRLQGDKVRLGIEAPKTTKVLRGELVGTERDNDNKPEVPVAVRGPAASQ